MVEYFLQGSASPDYSPKIWLWSSSTDQCNFRENIGSAKVIKLEKKKTDA
jgi:hypothetical protein